VNDHQNDDLSKRRGCATSATPHPRRKARRGVTTLRISGRVRGGSFVDPATPAASPNVKGAQENTSVSGESRGPLCYTPFSQVVSDRRRGREALSWRPVKRSLSALRLCRCSTRRSTSSTHQPLYEGVHLHPCIALDPDDSSSSLSRPGRVVSDQLQRLIYSSGVPPLALALGVGCRSRPRGPGVCHSLVMGRISAVARPPGA
jgi:hypothetical protein